MFWFLIVMMTVLFTLGTKTDHCNDSNATLGIFENKRGFISLANQFGMNKKVVS